jgi:small subunit ribosomal protein S1
VGVVVSGTHLTLDVDIGAAKLAQLPVQNLVPQDRISIENCKWVLADDAGGGDDGASSGVPAHGHPHVLYDQEVFAYESPAPLAVEIGTVLEIEVIGETLTGITLLSARRAASRVAFDRIFQVPNSLHCIFFFSW